MSSAAKSGAMMTKPSSHLSATLFSTSNRKVLTARKTKGLINSISARHQYDYYQCCESGFVRKRNLFLDPELFVSDPDPSKN